jgi:hypothetical protein
MPKNINMKICKTIIFHVVLWECEIWSLTLWEDWGCLKTVC